MHKAAHKVEAIITANVNMGKALVVLTASSLSTTLTAKQLKELGYNTVLGRSGPNAKWEYVVYDPSRIEPLSCKSTVEMGVYRL